MYCLIKLDKIEITFAKDIQIKPKFISFEKNRKTNKKRFQVKKKKEKQTTRERVDSRGLFTIDNFGCKMRKMLKNHLNIIA